MKNFLIICGARQQKRHPYKRPYFPVPDFTVKQALRDGVGYSYLGKVQQVGVQNCLCNYESTTWHSRKVHD